MSENIGKKESSAGQVDRLAMCRWWQPHKYTKWQDLEERSNNMNQPVLVQEKRCLVCNKAVRRVALLSEGT